MGYVKKTSVWLVVLVSLVWLTAATAKPDNGEAKGQDRDRGSQGTSNNGTGNGNSGSTGSTGPSGTTGSQGNGGSGNGNGQAGPPEVGVSMGAEPTGSVKVKLPGAAKAEALDGSQVIPMGSVVDARRGKIALTTALDAQGNTQTATFWGGVFRVGQRGGYTEIALAGRRPSCPVAGRAQISRRKKKRSLWAEDSHGHYRTRGQNSVATVRGTTWFTADRCDGTLTRVTHGAVVVKDRHTHRAVVVKAGHSYLARARHSG
jgi:hypothetical protein